MSDDVNSTAAPGTPGTTAPANTADATAPDAPAADAPPVVADAATPDAPATPDTPAVVAPVVPETYDLKLPADSTLDPAIVERTAAIARELGLSNEAGQKALDFAAAERSAAVQEYEAARQPGGPAWKENVTRLEAEALADPEIGGSPEKLAASAELGKQALTKFFPPEIKAFLDETGLGSDPRVLRGLVKIAKGMGEGKLVLGGTSDGDSNSEEAKLARMYPSMVKKSA
jgi:hypothetical protein